MSRSRASCSRNRRPVSPKISRPVSATSARGADGRLRYIGYPEPPYGTFAERVSVPAGMRFELPDSADPVQVAAGVTPGLATWLPLTARAAEMPLGTVLVLEATGTAGRLAVQNARRLGAEQIVAVGRDPEASPGPPNMERHRPRGSPATRTRLASGRRWRAGRPRRCSTCSGVRRPRRSRRSPATASTTTTSTTCRSVLRRAADVRVPAALLRSRRLRITGSGAGSSSMAAIMEQVPVYVGLVGSGAITVPTRTFPIARAAEARQPGPVNGWS